MIPMRKIMDSNQWYFMANEMIKNVTPKNTATPVTMWMKCSISRAIGVFPEPKPEAKLAIRPMTVLSPILTTIPVAVPSTAFVEKKARFFVSSGLSDEHSLFRDWGSDSPVKDELSTYIELNKTCINIFLARVPYYWKTLLPPKNQKKFQKIQSLNWYISPIHLHKMNVGHVYFWHEWRITTTIVGLFYKNMWCSMNTKTS